VLTTHYFTFLLECVKRFKWKIGVKSCSPSKQRFEIGQLRSFILLNVYMMLLSILLLVPLQSNLMCNVTIYILMFS
jgi:hypothetical protein